MWHFKGLILKKRYATFKRKKTIISPDKIGVLAGQGIKEVEVFKKNLKLE